MYKFMQKNKKKLLAIFGVVLMVVFILPTVALDRTGYGSDNVVANLRDDQPLMINEVRAAQDQWRDVVTYLAMEAGSVGLAAAEIDKNPELFVLLQREARQMGLRVSDDQVTQALTRIGQQFAMFGRQPPQDLGRLRPAMHNLLLVRGLFDRVADSVKPSGPLAMREAAEQGQRVKLQLVHYAGEDFAKTVTAAPTDEQLQKQFEEFKATQPGFPDDRNPFGFGYLVPARVKLLYFTVPRAEAAATVRKSKEQIDWETQAVLHYRQNLSKYPVTQPSETQPTTGGSATQSATKPAGPTTRPFSEVKQQVIDEVMRPDVDRKVDEVATALHERLTADFEARQRKSASAPEDFGTKQYYDRVVADVEKRFGIRLGVSEINDPKDDAGLRAIKGIGQSYSGDTTFADYVLRWSEPLVVAGMRGNREVLSLDEPSPRFRDLEGNVYVFQVRDATPAAPPAKLADVRAKVEADARTKQAFDAAVAEAKRLRDAAEKSGLSAAADAAKKDVFTTSDFFNREGLNSSFDQVTLIPAVELPPPARQRLVGEAFNLLAKATPDAPHPVAVVELPAASRVVVAELSDVERAWRDEQQDLLQYQLGRQIAAQRAQRLLTDYFTFDAVKNRLGYQNPREK